MARKSIAALTYLTVWFLWCGSELLRSTFNFPLEKAANLAAHGCTW